MQQNSRNISLKFECGQKWSAMDPCGKEKFCRSCQSKVYDLRNQTPAYIDALLAANNGRACGYFLDEQLGESEKRVPRSVLSVLSLGLASLLALHPVKIKAQIPLPAVTEQHPLAFSKAEVKQGDSYREQQEVFNAHMSLNAGDEPKEEVKTKKRRHTVLHMGRRYLYVSRRLPFIGIGIMRMGMWGKF